METLLNLQGTIFLLIAAGVFVRKKNIVTEEGQKSITDLVINLILPCNIIRAFCVEFSDQMGTDLMAVLLMSVIVQGISVFYGKWMFRKENSDRRKCLRYATICSNAGFLGNPVAEGTFGFYGLMLASIFLIPLRIMMWTEGIFLFSGTKDKKDVVRNALTHPCILATIIGIILMVTGYRFPVPISETISKISACNTAMSMLVIGMILSNMKWQDLIDKSVLNFCFHRLILLPLIIYGIAELLSVSPIVRGVAVLLTAMPAGATTSILSSKYEVEPEFAAKLVVCSTLLSIPTLAVWSAVLI